MSLWCLLAAPLLAGNDLSNMTEDTRSILMNHEVIAIDQDPAANPAQLVTYVEKQVVAYRKLHDGSTAVAFSTELKRRTNRRGSGRPSGSRAKTSRPATCGNMRPSRFPTSTIPTTVPPHGVVMAESQSNNIEGILAGAPGEHPRETPIAHLLISRRPPRSRASRAKERGGAPYLEARRFGRPKRQARPS